MKGIGIGVSLLGEVAIILSFGYIFPLVGNWIIESTVSSLLSVGEFLTSSSVFCRLSVGELICLILWAGNSYRSGVTIYETGNRAPTQVVDPLSELEMI